MNDGNNPLLVSPPSMLKTFQGNLSSLASSLSRMDAYNNAIKTLNQLHNSELRKRNQGKKREAAVDRTRKWLHILGVKDNLEKIHFIHVAGTKGKGTTCLYCERLLMEHQRLNQTPRRIGCLTSPHIIDIRERIRVNNNSISRELFAKYFWELWDQIQRHCPQPDLEGIPSIPGYPGFLTLLGFYVFAQEKVDVAIIETGIGGERDSTNIITRPSATGITTLGLDHVNVLGNDIRSIAWHKAGIFKASSPAFTVEQDEPALEVLQQRSVEKRTSGALRVVTEEIVHRYNVVVHPDMPFQRRNASLALALTETCLKYLDPDYSMTKDLASSLEDTCLPGKCEVLTRLDNTWLLSVAHNEMSVKETTTWFRETLELPQHRDTQRILIFNHESRRDSNALLDIVYRTLCVDSFTPIHKAIFCSNVTGFGEQRPDLVDFRLDPVPTLKTQHDHAGFWQRLGGCSDITVLPSVKASVEFVSSRYSGASVVVAGSLYLASAVRTILETGRS